jgi:SAM-dependent methyltransferase
MSNGPPRTVDGALEGQRAHWDTNCSQRPEMFGAEASRAAAKAAGLFRQEGKTTMLELGGGQGRDTLFFAREGFDVTVLDYSQAATEAIAASAAAAGVAAESRPGFTMSGKPSPTQTQASTAATRTCCVAWPSPLPSCYAFRRRSGGCLKPGGLRVYTVRHTGDPHRGSGIHRGEDMYEVGGFIHFFSLAIVHQLATGLRGRGRRRVRGGRASAQAVAV